MRILQDFSIPDPGSINTRIPDPGSQHSFSVKVELNYFFFPDSWGLVLFINLFCCGIRVRIPNLDRNELFSADHDSEEVFNFVQQSKLKSEFNKLKILKF
jgi:hypothetical protein